MACGILPSRFRRVELSGWAPDDHCISCPERSRVCGIRIHGQMPPVQSSDLTEAGESVQDAILSLVARGAGTVQALRGKTFVTEAEAFFNCVMATRMIINWILCLNLPFVMPDLRSLPWHGVSRGHLAGSETRHSRIRGDDACEHYEE
jgi:hypothetical protein